MRIRRSTTELHPLCRRGELSADFDFSQRKHFSKVPREMDHTWLQPKWVPTHAHIASIAQWQSTGLVNQGSRVQTSLEAKGYFFISCIIPTICLYKNILPLLPIRVCGLMDKAPDFGSGDCRFESCHARHFIFGRNITLRKKYRFLVSPILIVFLSSWKG